MKNMKRAHTTLSVLMLALVLACGTCLTALAAADPSTLRLDEPGSVTLTLYSDEAEEPLAGAALTLYEVAELTLDDGSMLYRYTDAYAGCEAVLSDVSAASLADTLAQFALEWQAKGRETRVTDESGEVTFQDLSLGLYLIVQTVRTEGYYMVEPFLVTVPLAGADGWIYRVNATPKVEVYQAPPVPETQGETNPETPVRTPAASDSSVSVKPEAPAPRTLPQTGQLNWPVAVLAVCGLALICLGSCFMRAGRRQDDAA